MGGVGGRIKRWEWSVGSRSVLSGRGKVLGLCQRKAGLAPVLPQLGCDGTTSLKGEPCQGITAKEPPELCSKQPAFHRNSRPGGRDQGVVWGEAVQRCSLGALRMEAVKRPECRQTFLEIQKT